MQKKNVRIEKKIAVKYSASFGLVTLVTNTGYNRKNNIEKVLKSRKAIEAQHTLHL